MNIDVLDVGYVKFIESWGHGEAGVAEAGIIEAARQSTQGSFRGWELDEKLLGFLFNSNPPHSTPFEFAGLIIEVQAPIFVFREWHRHRTQWYNEMSARYSPLPNLNYIPTIERCMLTDKKNKQAQGVDGSVELTEEAAIDFIETMKQHYVQAEEVYQNALKFGVPKEVARIGLPVGRYSRMRAGANLRNWLAFMTLRHHPKAQWEIQQFAGAVGQILEQEFPRVMSLFNARKIK